MKIIRVIAAVLLVLWLAPGVSAQEQNEMPKRVVSLHASYADAWLTAGGELVGVPENAFEFSEQLANCGAENLGSHDKPNMELLFQLEPDYVILSSDNQNHKEIGEILTQAGIAHDFYGATDWRDYMEMMRKFTVMTGREDLYQQQVEQVQLPIEVCIQKTQALDQKPTALLLRAYSSGGEGQGQPQQCGWSHPSGHGVRKYCGSGGNFFRKSLDGANHVGGSGLYFCGHHGSQFGGGNEISKRAVYQQPCLEYVDSGARRALCSP